MTEPASGFEFAQEQIDWGIPSEEGNLKRFAAAKAFSVVQFGPSVNHFIFVGSDFIACVQRAIVALVKEQLFASAAAAGREIRIDIPMDLMQTTVDLKSDSDSQYRTTMDDLQTGKIPIRLYTWLNAKSFASYVSTNFFMDLYPPAQPPTQSSNLEPVVGPFLFGVPAKGIRRILRDSKSGELSGPSLPAPEFEGYANAELALRIWIDHKPIFSFNESGKQKVNLHFWSSSENPEFLALIEDAAHASQP